jgi:Na+-translocating ferredoxin:NAD+ oxidoreductase subunit A
MRIISELISAALYAMVIQNFIFTGGYGASEAVRMAAKPKQLYPMTFFITLFSTSVSVICVLLEPIDFIKRQGAIGHAIEFVAVLSVMYIIVLTVSAAVFRAKDRTIRRIGIAAFNTLVIAVPFINYRAVFTISEAVGSGIGSGFAFVIAVLLINVGLRRLDRNPNIPEAFKGTPAIFIYVSILSLAFSGFAGSGLTM